MSSTFDLSIKAEVKITIKNLLAPLEIHVKITIAPSLVEVGVGVGVRVGVVVVFYLY